MTSGPPIGLRAALREALRTKSGIVGFAMLGVLLGMSVGIPLYASFDVISVWSSPGHWLDNPRAVPPEWIEIFYGKHLPRTIILQPKDFNKGAVPSALFDQTFVRLEKKIPYSYDGFPTELNLLLWTSFNSTAQVTVTWTRPDGERVVLFDTAPSLKPPTPNVYSLSSTLYTDPLIQTLQSNLKDWISPKHVIDSPTLAKVNIRPEIALFAVLNKDITNASAAQVLKGDYALAIEMKGYSRTDDIDARFTALGQVHGLAGTDGKRRDLLVGLLWGAPVALAFGTAAALVVVLIQTFLGAASGWYGGRMDEVVQRGSDFFLIIPVLPILILFSLFYRPGLTTILAVVVSFGLLGSTSKVVRSLVIQLKEEQFIEAALSYGASRARILFRYIMPRVMPYTFALVTLNVPAFIFLEASLSFLGLGDPGIPTWGSILGDAYNGGALYVTPPIWWWVAFPAAGILFAAVAFSLLGYSFDKVLNPRLREE